MVPARPSFRPTIVAVDKLADAHEEPSGADHDLEAFLGVCRYAKKASPFGGLMKIDTR